jgi:hypothetical protein
MFLCHSEVDGKTICNMISFSSKKLKRVVKSTLAGETIAMVDGLDEAVCLAYLHDELSGRLSQYSRHTPVHLIRNKNPNNKVLPIQAHTDCKSLVDHILCPKPKVQEQRLMVDLAAIRDDIASGVISSVRWCPTKLNPADGMTKPDKSGNFVRILMSNEISIE